MVNCLNIILPLAISLYLQGRFNLMTTRSVWEYMEGQRYSYYLSHLIEMEEERNK